MNDSMSLLLATTILALGGLGLYMYKSSDDNKDNIDKEENYDEENIYGNSNFFNWIGSNEKEEDERGDEDYNEEEYKPRKRNTKTQRNRKSAISSRRRY